LRVFLGTQEIAGYYASLCEGFKELGIEATFVDLSDHPFQYGPAEALPLASAIRGTINARRVRPRRSMGAFGLLAYEAVLRTLLLLWAVFKFDAFIFGFGSTLLQRSAIDLKLLRLLRKRTVFVFHGSDARPPYLNGPAAPAGGIEAARACADRAKAIEQRVSLIDRYADVVVDNALSSHFHKRRCVHWIVIGVPCTAPTDAEPVFRSEPQGSIRVLHSPSNPESKGTERIRQAIAVVKRKGYNIDYVEISNKTHADVLVELARADVVVDQLYSDTPMATFATEAAHFGKPALVGGYGMDAFREMLPQNAMPPTLYCHPDDLESSLEQLCANQSYRRELGQHAKNFVQSNWTRRQVASRLLRLLNGDFPQSWLFDPRDIRYCHGYGQTENHARHRIAELIALQGVDALCVGDKPDLEHRLREFAHREACSQRMPSCSSSS